MESAILVVIILSLMILPFFLYIFYFIHKHAVENGVYDALKKIENEKSDRSKNDAEDSR